VENDHTATPTPAARVSEEDGARSPVLWPHTGIVAPAALTLRNYKEMDTTDGYAFMGEVVHPALGMLGWIENRGHGDGTTFTPATDRFTDRDMIDFIAQCREDGRPFIPHGGDVRAVVDREGFLDALRVEHLSAKAVQRMRHRNETLLRGYAPATVFDATAWRGNLLGYPGILLSPAERRQAADQLRGEAATRLRLGEHWQMFNGSSWTALFAEPQLTTEQVQSRIEAITALCSASSGLLVNAGPVDGFHLTGFSWTAPECATDTLWLIEDKTTTLHPHEWCRCEDKSNLKPIRFEGWSREHGLIASGGVHGDGRCRRLLVMN
jgi:hypothetical protein